MKQPNKTVGLHAQINRIHFEITGSNTEIRASLETRRDFVSLRSAAACVVHSRWIRFYLNDVRIPVGDENTPPGRPCNAGERLWAVVLGVDAASLSSEISMHLCLIM